MYSTLGNDSTADMGVTVASDEEILEKMTTELDLFIRYGIQSLIELLNNKIKKLCFNELGLIPPDDMDFIWKGRESEEQSLISWLAFQKDYAYSILAKYGNNYTLFIEEKVLARRRINMFINCCNAIFTSYADLADTDIHVAIEKLLKKEK